MPQETWGGTSRRTVLKSATILSSVGVVGSLAGCTGGDGTGDGSDGDGGDGGDGDGGGDGAGDNGNGGQTQPQDLETLRIALAPLGIVMFPLDYIENRTSILEDNMNDVGFEAQITRTWEEKALGAAGQADLIPTIGTVEAARLGAEREMQVTAIMGAMLTQYSGPLVRTGDKYDPEVAGSEQASMDRIVEDQANFGIGSWSAGVVPPDRLIIGEKYGYEFKEDGDFNVLTADFYALATLLNQGDLDVAETAPPLHAPMMMGDDPKLTPIYYIPNALEEIGLLWNNLALANVVTTQNYIDDNFEAIEAFVKSWHEGAKWMNQQEPSDLIQSEEDVKSLGAESQEEAEFILDWSFNTYKDSVVPTNVELTDEYIKNDKEALNKVADAGLIPSNWDDFLEYRKVPQS